MTDVYRDLRESLHAAIAASDAAYLAAEAAHAELHSLTDADHADVMTLGRCRDEKCRTHVSRMEELHAFLSDARAVLPRIPTG